MKYKLIFTIPVTDADKVREAVGKAGAGKYDHYSFCSFSTRGIGRFVAEEGAHPSVGEVGKMNEVQEERVECQVDENVVDDVIKALKEAHPYEEVAYDLFSLETR